MLSSRRYGQELTSQTSNTYTFTVDMTDGPRYTCEVIEDGLTSDRSNEESFVAVRESF